MYYASICLIALLIHLIVNHNIIIRRSKHRDSTTDKYRAYLDSITVFFLVDALWGIFDHYNLTSLLYLDTVVYYVAQTVTLVCWCIYVIAYLNLRKFIGRLISWSALIFCIAEVALLAFNYNKPLFFHFNSSGLYETGTLRYIALLIQFILFAVIAVQAIITASSSKTGSQKRRNITICFFCLAMGVTVVVQTNFPLFPIYTIGLMIGICILHVFVQEDENDEIREQLQENEETLRERSNIYSNAGFGVWKISTNSYGVNTMSCDETALKLLGINQLHLNPEGLYNYYHSRILEDVDVIESGDYEDMKKGAFRSRIVSWNHPSKGKIYLNAGGTSFTTSSGEVTISGYVSDVTAPHKLELRNNKIINSFTQSYEFIMYFNVPERRIVTSIGKTATREDVASLLSKGNLNTVLEEFCAQFVSNEDRDEMLKFSEMRTINERMRNVDSLVNQYKNWKDMWFEWTFVVADRKADGSIFHLIWALRKIDDEKQAELRKQKMLEDNIAANSAKTMFLQNMSHEIRTPLNAMFGFAQLLGLPDGSWSDDEKETYNRYIFNSYTMLDMLIGDIIDIADSEHDNYRISISDVNVNEICNSAIMSVEFRVPADVKMYFTSELSDDHVVKSDGRRIQQVLVNYLTNACKHTQSGEIHLHCSSSETPGKLTFSVTDTGEGVPVEKADIIFNRFTKIDKFAQGSGLGLNICLLIAEKLGGEVFLDTSYAGPGARFVFVIDDK